MKHPVVKTHDAMRDSLSNSISAAESGALQLEDSAAYNAAAACNLMITRLTNVQGKIDNLRRIEGMDGFTSSVNLREEVLKPKTGTSKGGEAGSFGEVIAQHILTLEKMRDLYIKAGNAYQEVEHVNDSEFANLTPDK